MSNNLPKEIESIINQHTALAVGAAFIPIPVADSVAIGGVQVAMIARIASHYDRLVSKETLKSLVMNALAANAGVWLAGMLKFIPILGTIAGTAIQMSVAGGITYMFGLAVNHIFAHDLDFTKENFEKFTEQFKSEGKEKAKDVKEQAKAQKEINKQIDFHSTQNTFRQQVTFKFNTLEYTPEYLEIRKESDGEKVLREDLHEEMDSYTWRPDSSVDKGKYVAYLKLSSLLPLSTRVTYE